MSEFHVAHCNSCGQTYLTDSLDDCSLCLARGGLTEPHATPRSAALTLERSASAQRRAPWDQGDPLPTFTFEPPEMLVESKEYFVVASVEGGVELRPTNRWTFEERREAGCVSVVLSGMALLLFSTGACAMVQGAVIAAVLLWAFGFGLSVSILWAVTENRYRPDRLVPLAVVGGEVRHGGRVLCALDDVIAVQLCFIYVDDDAERQYTAQLVTTAGLVRLPGFCFGITTPFDRATSLAHDLAAVLERPVADEVADLSARA